MLTKLRKRLADEEGFTLIELLVVVLIIGILAAVAIPTFLSQKNKAYDSNAQSNLKNAQTIVESYSNGNGGAYPTTSGTFGGSGGVFALDSDASSIGSSVNYIGSTSSTADSYELTATSTAPNATVFWIDVYQGQAYYGTTTANLPAVNTAPGSSVATTTAGWTAATSS